MQQLSLPQVTTEKILKNYYNEFAWDPFKEKLQVLTEIKENVQILSMGFGKISSDSRRYQTTSSLQVSDITSVLKEIQQLLSASRATKEDSVKNIPLLQVVGMVERCYRVYLKNLQILAKTFSTIDPTLSKAIQQSVETYQEKIEDEENKCLSYRQRSYEDVELEEKDHIGLSEAFRLYFSESVIEKLKNNLDVIKALVSEEWIHSDKGRFYKSSYKNEAFAKEIKWTLKNILWVITACGCLNTNQEERLVLREVAGRILFNHPFYLQKLKSFWKGNQRHWSKLRGLRHG